MAGVIYGCICPHPPVLVPEIGNGNEKNIASTGNAMLRIAEDIAQSSPDVIFVISPHGTAYYQAMGVVNAKTTRGDLRGWGATGLNYRYNNDINIVNTLVEETKKLNVPVKLMGDKGYNLDHGVLVPFYFLNKVISSIPVIPLTFSWLPLSVHYDFGKAIKNTVEKMNKRAIIIASGDLSHRLTVDAPAGYDPLGEVFDKKIVQAISTYDKDMIMNLDQELIERAGECGLRSITILLGAMDGLQVDANVLSYEGPFGVGYMVASLKVKIELKEKTVSLISVAKEAVENYIKSGITIKPKEIIPQLSNRAGVFVCIKKRGELRGCIGTFEPTKDNIMEETIYNAISAAINDPRFIPINDNELQDLSYSVDVLTQPELVDSKDKLDPKRYGIILEGKFGKKGLLLPDLEGVNTVDQQYNIVLNKAGLSPDEEVKIYRFEVQRYQ